MSELLFHLFSTQGLIVGTILPFLVILTIVVFVHEMGHYLVGRWCGIGVDAFSIGFGPEIVGYTARNGTRWKLSAVPLGGYVKFKGEMSVTGQATDDCAEPETETRGNGSFEKQSVLKRALTVFAGPAANFVLTVIVFAFIIAINGRYVMNATVAEVLPESPAAEAGILPGDRFVSLDGQRVDTFADVQRYVSARAEEPIEFVMDRDGSTVAMTVVPARREVQDPLGNTAKIGQIGVRNSEEVGEGRLERYGPVESLGLAIAETWSIVERTGMFLSRFVKGREDKCQLGGPVKIADMAGKAAQKGWFWSIQLVALLSVGIGILNLLPIPPLDGGHLLFYGLEAMFGGPVSPRVVEHVYRVGFVLVMAFMGFVFWNDLFAC